MSHTESPAKGAPKSDTESKAPKDSTIVMATPQDITTFVNPGSPIPTPEQIYILPANFIKAVSEIAPKIQKTGAWWALGGDMAEMQGGVSIRPKNIEILTNKEGVEKIFQALAEYSPSPVALTETKLEREAEIAGKKYPVTVRSQRTTFSLHGAEVVVHGGYQMRVGDWDWGDPLEFKAPMANIVGIRIPVTPIRLSSEIYLTLGWNDRAQMIADAIAHAHHGRGQYGDETRSAAYDAQLS